MEGRHCYNATTCNKSGKTLPITEYAHGERQVLDHRRLRLPRAPPSRSWWATTSSPTSAAGGSGRSSTPAEMATSVLQADTSEQITSFGESDDGELYAVTIDGKLFRVLAS